jgi:hypothetical protein
MRRRWISALVGLAGASTGFEVLAAEYVQILEAPAPPAQLPLGETLGTHDGDMIGVMPGEFVLIRQGAIVKRFSVDGMSPSKSSTGPRGHVYLLFAGSLGGVVKVIDPAGSLVREIVCPELVNPIAFAVDSTGGFVALVRPAPDVEDPQPLLYRFDAAGSLRSTQLPGEVGRSRQMFRIAAGEGGEVALLRADEEMVYWLGARLLADHSAWLCRRPAWCDPQPGAPEAGARRRFRVQAGVAGAGSLQPRRNHNHRPAAGRGGGGKPYRSRRKRPAGRSGRGAGVRPARALNPAQPVRPGPRGGPSLTPSKSDHGAAKLPLERVDLAPDLLEFLAVS